MSKLEGTDDGGGRTQEGGTGAALLAGTIPTPAAGAALLAGTLILSSPAKVTSTGPPGRPNLRNSIFKYSKQTNKHYLCL